MRQVVARCGGLQSIMDVMLDDFDPDPSDSEGLRKYLMGLTREITDRPR